VAKAEARLGSWVETDSTVGAHFGWSTMPWSLCCTSEELVSSFVTRGGNPRAAEGRTSETWSSSRTTVFSRRPTAHVSQTPLLSGCYVIADASSSLEGNFPGGSSEGRIVAKRPQEGLWD
jgi:hypothetical protein